MQNKKRMVLLFDYFQDVHLYKDVGMIPYYFYKMFGFNSTIVSYSKDKNTEENYKGLIINKIKKILLDPFIFYLLKNSKKTDLLMMFHNKDKNYFYRKLFKFLNPKGLTYLKLDMNIFNVQELQTFYDAYVKFKDIFKLKQVFFEKLKIIKRYFLFKKIKKELSKFDVVSIENKNFYEKLKQLLNLNNLYYIPNGFDDLDENIPKVLSFEQKDNIIITVGRIGTKEKNNEMILNALKKIDLKDWKVYFIGPVEKEFIFKINDFYSRFPGYKEKIFFTGEIKERQKLYDFYNRSKVFCSTSLWESYGIAMLEAAYFGNYIISTDTGAIKEITNEGELGSIIEINNTEMLVKEIQSIINQEKNIEQYCEKIKDFCRKKFLWSNIILKLSEIISMSKR